MFETRMKRSKTSSGPRKITSIYAPQLVRKKRQAKTQPRNVVRVSLVECHNSSQEIVRKIIRKFGWQEVHSADEPCDILWTDQKAAKLGESFRILSEADSLMTNHFPGMQRMCNKHSLHQSLAYFQHLAPMRYDFFPRSWSNRSREDMHAFARHCSPGLPRPASTGAGGKAFIIKPDGGMQGAGITLAQDYQQVVRILEERAQERLVVQEYLADPLLLDGYKFDMRVYVLVQSLSPLKVFVFREGLARLCTIKYRPPTSKNIDCAYMHLTNYSLNKKNDNFHKAGSGSGSGPGRGDGSSIGAPDRASKGGGGGGKAMLGDSMYDDMSSKRSISTALGQLQLQGESIREEAFWEEVEDLVSKSLLAMWDRLWGQYSFHFPPNTNSNSAHTAMNHKTRPGNGRRMSPPPPSAPLAVSPSRCFHLLGFDVMLDRQHKIWLLEVNSTPSFNADSLLDLSIKQTVIERSLEIMHFIKRGVRRRERKGGRRRKGTEGGNVDGDEVEEEEEELSLEMLAMQRKIEQIKRELNQEKNKKKKKKKRKEKKKKKKEKEKEESERDRVGGGTKERKESQDPSQQEVEARPLKDKDAQTKQEVETDGESVGKSQRDGKNMAGEGEVNRSLDSNWSDVSDGPVSPDIEDGGMSRGDGEGGVGGVGGARQGGGVDRKEESSNSDTGKEDNKECDDNDANDAHEVGEVGGDGGVNGRNNSTSASHADTNCFPFPAPLPPSPPSPASDQRPSIDHTGPSTRLALTCACIRDIADRHTKDQKDGDEKEAGEGNEGEGGGAHREEDDVNSDGDENHHRNKINGRNGQGDSDGWNGSDAAQNQNVQGLQGPRGCAEHAPCCEEREKQRAALRACDPLQPRVVQNIQDARDKDSGGAGNHGEGSREEKENIASNNHGDGEAGRQDGLLFLAVATCEDTSRFSASKGSDSYDNNQDLNIGHTNASLANSNAEENGHDDRDKSDKSDGNVGGDDCDDVSAKGCRVDPRTQNSHQHVQDQMQLQHSSSMHKIRSSPLNARKRERTGRDSRERRGGGAQRIHSSSRGSMRGSGGHGLRSVRPQSTEKAGEGSEKRKDGKRKTGKKIRKGGHQVRYIESLKSGVLQRAGILAQVQRLHELQQERRMWNSVVTNASKHGQKRRQRQRLAEKQKQNMKQSMKVKQGKKKGKEREEENGKEEGSNTQRMKDKSMQTNQINNTFKKQGENLKNIELGLKQQRGGSHGAHAHHITGYSTSNTNTDKENLHHDHHHKHYYGDGHNNHIRTHEQRAHETGVGKLLAGEKERRGMSIKDQTKGKKGTQRDVCTDNLSNETNMSGEASVRTMRRSKSAGHFLPSLAKHRAAEGKKQRKARRGGREEREEREAPKQVNTLIGSIHPRQYQGEGVTTKEETQRQRHTGSAWEGSEKAGRPLSLSSLSSSAFNKPMTLAHSTSSSSSPSSSLGLSFLARAKATSAGAVQRRRLERLQMQDRDYLYEERRLLAQVHSRNKNNSKDSNRVTTVNTMNTSNTRTAGYFAHPINGSEVSSGSESGSDHDNNNKNSDSETGTDTNSDIDGESEGRLSQSLALSDEAIKRRAWLRAKREKVMRRKKSQQRKIRRQERQTSGYSSYTSYSIATNAVSLVNSSVTGKRNRKKWSRGERKKHAHIQMKMQDMVVSPLNPALSHSQLFVFGGNQYLPFLYAQACSRRHCKGMTSNTFKRILYTYQLCRESRTTSSVSTPNFRSRATSYYQHTTPAKSDKKPRASKAVLQGRNVEATKMKVAKTDSNSKRGVKEEEDNGSSSSLSSSSFHTPQKNRRITATNRDKDSRGIHKNNKSPSASSSLSSLPSSSTSSLILSPSEVDLLFMKSMKIKGRRGREQAYGNSQSRLMDFPQFCRAIMRLATLAHSAMTPIDAIQLLLMNAQTRFYTTIDSHV